MNNSLLSIRDPAVILSGMETLGQRVKREMEQRRPPIKGYQLAQRLNRQQSYVSKLVNDQLKDIPPPEVLHGLERELGVPVEWSLRALGYVLEIAEEPRSGATPISFPDNSPAAKIVEILYHLPDEQAVYVLGMARFAERRARGEPDEDEAPVVQLGTRRRVG